MTPPVLALRQMTPPGPALRRCLPRPAPLAPAFGGRHRQSGGDCDDGDRFSRLCIVDTARPAPPAPIFSPSRSALIPTSASLPSLTPLRAKVVSFCHRG